MHGDFSRWSLPPDTNDQGLLHQQGRVLLDTDVSNQARLVTRWEDEAARAAFGAGVAAVSMESPDGFRVTAAERDGDGARITLLPGQIWADGLLAYLSDGGPWLADYLDAVTDPGAAGTRDAVVLELWREAHSAFMRTELLEPALGGPDTTERLHTSFALRLERMSAGETCADVAARVRDDLSSRAHLTVHLQPPDPGDDPDCPTEDAGGYTGFEHNLYRIEIAEVGPSAPGPMFKWSRYNGGLVGRGTFDAAEHKLHVNANKQAIASSEVTDGYLEAIAWDADRGYWRVVYGAVATRANDDELDLAATPLFGSMPTEPAFFRLWDGIAQIDEYPAGADLNYLNDGILVGFGTGDHRPGDYWVFPLRAGLDNPPVLVNDAPPEGVVRHRVPLAVLRWTGSDAISADSRLIDDCRRPFPPLTKLSGCCTVRVGDGVHSFGDVTSVQEAIERLPPEGGKVCVLPGEYEESVTIVDRSDVVVAGCGPRSRIVAAAPTGEFATSDPAIHITGGSRVRIESLAVVAREDGIGVLVNDGQQGDLPRDIDLEDLDVSAATRAGIEVRAASGLHIRGCRVVMADVESQWSGIVSAAEDALIERNLVTVKPAVIERMSERLSAGLSAGTTAAAAPRAHAGLGGIWLRGGSARVRVVNNDVKGGIGHGVVLGHAVTVNRPGRPDFGWVFGEDDECAPCLPGTVIVVNPGPSGDTHLVAGPPLEQITIAGNRLLGMGLAGIGAFGFFESDDDGIISVDGLTIVGNRIAGCLSRPLARIPDAMRERMGYGAIMLADVIDLLVRDNRIQDNGPTDLDPVCGVYVYAGEGIELAGNRISDNGAISGERAAGAAPGARGGVYIQLATAPTAAGADGVTEAGPPALQMHGNIVVAPLGPALQVQALGPVAVNDNRLASLGVTSETLGGSAVRIDDLGAARDLANANKRFYFLREGLLRPQPLGMWRIDNGALDWSSNEVLAAAAPRRVLTGPVMFADNQVLQRLRDRASRGISAITISSLDDVEFADNQCNLMAADDFYLVQALLAGYSVRVTGCRFQETLGRVIYSAASIGQINTTAHNHSTHCLRAIGSMRLIKNDNIELVELVADRVCERVVGVLPAPAASSELELLR